MTPHRFDPVSATFGVVTVAVGLIVATGSTDRMAVDGGWWLALVVFALGLAVVGSSLRRLNSDDHDSRTE